MVGSVHELPGIRFSRASASVAESTSWQVRTRCRPRFTPILGRRLVSSGSTTEITYEALPRNLSNSSSPQIAIMQGCYAGHIRLVKLHPNMKFYHRCKLNPVN